MHGVPKGAIFFCPGSESCIPFFVQAASFSERAKKSPEAMSWQNAKASPPV